MLGLDSRVVYSLNVDPDLWNHRKDQPISENSAHGILLTQHEQGCCCSTREVFGLR